MGKLVSVEKVRERINFDSIADVDAVIDSILCNQTADLEADLRTKFDYGTRTDTWFVQNSFTPAPGAFQTWLACKQGLVSGLTSIVYAGSMAGLATGTSLLASTVSLDGGEKGQLLVMDVDISGYYVQATYTAGLQESAAGVHQGVPPWLEELAILRAILKLDSIHPTVRFDDGSAVSIERLQGLISDGVAQHMRYLPRAVRAF